jgi:hypothetical protein
MNETAENTIVAGKETVIRRRGATWEFHLPHGHEIQLDPSNQIVMLSIPSQSSGYVLDGLEETAEEVVVCLGEEHGRSGPPTVGDGPISPALGYPLPLIQDEFERLASRYEEAGLPRQEIHAYAQGSGHGEQLRFLRKRLRDAGNRP